MSASNHIDLSVLAQCAEGTLPEDEARNVREHLADCRSCFSAYVDAVRYRAAWLADPQAFELNDQDRALLQRLRAAEATDARLPQRPQLRRWIAAAGGIMAVLAVTTLIPRGPGAPTLGFRLDPAIREATVRSVAGGLVVPGVERQADATISERGTAAGPHSMELEAEVKAAIRAYESGQRSAESGARVVAALLADGDVAAADDYAEEVLRAYPDDVPLLVFAATAKARANDLTGAEELLRHALRLAPRDPVVALDLGLVLCRMGRAPESRPWFERATQSSVTALASRAQRELKSCGARR